MKEAGFEIVPGDTAIVPVMLYDEILAGRMADMLLEEGIYVISFSYPVVPKGKARIRVQLSAAHTRENLDFALERFIAAGKKLKILA
jgi:glycine C-acetyltransferase